MRVSSSVSVLVPPAFRGPTAGVGTIPTSGATVREALEAIDTAHPGFGRQVFAQPGRTHSFIKVFVNGSQVAGVDLDVSVNEGDEIEIVSAIGGG